MSAARPREEGSEVRTQSRPDCYLCGAPGVRAYGDLLDLLCGAAGAWSISRCSNRSCGLMWLDPMPVEADLGTLYRRYHTHGASVAPPLTVARRVYRRLKDGYLAGRYGYSREAMPVVQRLLGQLLSLHPGRRADADFGVKHLTARPGGALLEVGCGGGESLRQMEALGWVAEGVDFDPAAVRNAQAQGVRVRLGDVSRQAYPAESFEAVVLSHVIEHLPDPVSTLRECRRVLKKGGRLVVITPNTGSWGHRLFGPHWRGLEPPRHLFLFNRQTLTAVAHRSGFPEARVWAAPRAREILAESRRLKAAAEGRRPSKGSVWTTVWAESMELLEAGRLAYDPDAGEELTLVTERSSP